MADIPLRRNAGAERFVAGQRRGQIPPHAAGVRRGTLVIGYGNTLRGDDGLGSYIAGIIAQWPTENLRTMAVAQLTLELCEAVITAERVIFVDARLEGDEPVRVEPLVARAESVAMSHALSPAAVLAGAAALHGWAPPAWWVTVRAEDCSMREGLSATALRNASLAIAVIQKLQSPS